MPQFHIDEVYTKNSVCPMVVNFQNGYTTDAFDEANCCVLENPESGVKTIATELDNLLYVGEEEEQQLGKTLILARNKITGKVRLIEVGYTELKPVIKNDLDTSQMLETSNLELSRKFGSKKQKQQMEQREKLKVNIETVTEQMIKVTKEVKQEQLDLTSYTNNDSEDFYIPPIDRTADKPEHVYDINKILSEEEYEKIYSQLETKDFLADMLPWLKNLVTKKKLSEKQTVLAVYANYLLKMYNTVAREISKKNFAPCPFSTSLSEIILKNFTSQTNGKVLRPGPYKDKSLCYAIVLILIVNDFKFELEGFCQALKLTANTASMKVRATGASVVNSGSKKMIQLKLPLNNKPGFRRKSAKF